MSVSSMFALLQKSAALTSPPPVATTVLIVIQPTRKSFVYEASPSCTMALIVARPGLSEIHVPFTQPVPGTVWTESGSTAGAKSGQLSGSTSIHDVVALSENLSHHTRRTCSPCHARYGHVGVHRVPALRRNHTTRRDWRHRIRCGCRTHYHSGDDGHADHRAEQHLLETSQVVLLSVLIPRRAIGAAVVQRRRMHDPSAPLALAPSVAAPPAAPLPETRTAGHTVVARVTGWLH